MNGFGSTSAQEWTEAFAADNEELLHRADQLLADCHGFLADSGPRLHDKRQILAELLFVRALEFYQATVLLSRRGMRFGSRASLRTLVEVLFHLGAFERDPSFVEKYVAADIPRRLRMYNKAAHSTTEYLSGLRSQEHKAIASELKDTVDSEGMRELRIEEVSTVAGLHDWYLTVYAALSSTVHVAVKDLERSVEHRDGAITKIRYGPESEGARGVIASAMEALVLCLGACASILGRDDLLDTCRSHLDYLGGIDLDSVT